MAPYNPPQPTMAPYNPPQPTQNPGNPYNPNMPNNNPNNNNNNNNPTQPAEKWKQYVRQNEQFSCAGKSDGFYPSKWCNVFYRCFGGNKNEFLCAKMVNGDRLWWIQHSTQTQLPQASAQCQWPCDTGKKCTSAGGILVEKSDGSVSDGQSDADRVWNSCGCNPSGGNAGVKEDNSDDLFRLPDAENSCANAADGASVPSAKYCNVFHVCISGVRKDFMCPKGSQKGQYDLWWNDATKRCEWPCKVQCSKQIFGGSQSASAIQSLDKQINAAECGSDSGSGSGSGGGSVGPGPGG